MMFGPVVFYKLTDCQVEFAFNLLQTIAVGLVKLAILFFYRRIFTGRVFKIASWTIITLTAAWTVVFLFNIIFACGSNVWAEWGSTNDLKIYCDNTVVMLEAMAITEFIIDLMIILLPVYWVSWLLSK